MRIAEKLFLIIIGFFEKKNDKIIRRFIRTPADWDYEKAKFT
jgi:hypothetical protein